MAGIWMWVGRHGLALKLGSGAAALVLLAGGLLLGMNSASGNAARQAVGGAGAPPQVVQATAHYLVGTVVESAPTPGRFIMRGRGGRYYVINYDGDTLIRFNRRGAGPSALRRGARVIVLGQPKQGRLHAQVVTVTGYTPARQVPASPTPSGRSTAVVATPHAASPGSLPPNPVEEHTPAGSAAAVRRRDVATRADSQPAPSETQESGR